jgi:hypothetical protein
MKPGSRWSNNQERDFAESLIRKGNAKSVTKLSENDKGDFIIDGINYEYKYISDITTSDLSNGLKKRMVEAAAQSDNIIIEIGQKNITQEIVDQALARFWGSNKTAESVTVRINGNDTKYTRPK